MSVAIDTARTKPLSERDLGQLTDEELVRRCRSRGERTAFETLVHRYERELYNYLRRYLGDAALAEDAFQATFLQVHLKTGPIRPGSKISALVVHNCNEPSHRCTT